MPKPRKSSLETPTARLKLPIQKKPHWLRLGPGLSLGYRRNAGSGTWSIRASDGHGGEWLKKFGIADDYEAADGKQLLTYSQAIDAARKLVRGGDVENQGKPVTVAAALAAYQDDLKARGANRYNAGASLKHLPAALLSKPVPLLETRELRKWRDGLLAKMTAASVNRVIGGLRAALNLLAAHDPRITRRAWELGLENLPDAEQARNVILTDQQVRRLVTAAYARNAQLGLFADVLAMSGARPSQASRLTVGDLIAHAAEPKLLMPRSAKGGGRSRVRRKIERTTIPITPGLAHRLKAAAAGRADATPLLLKSDGGAWGDGPSTYYRADIREIVAAIGLDPHVVTMYALRHSSIVRQLLANIPIRVVASLHDTSVVQIETNYSKYITEHSDQISRRALLDLDPPPVADNVVALAR